MAAVTLPAPEYIDYLLLWIQAQLDDEAKFPKYKGESEISGDIRLCHFAHSNGQG